MDKFHIELYPKADLENEWAKNEHTPGAMPCMRCGGLMRESLAENALSRALNVYVCPAHEVTYCIYAKEIYQSIRI